MHHAQLGLPLLLLPIIGVIGLSYRFVLTYGGLVTLFTGSLWPLPQLVVSCFELSMLLARVYSKDISKCFLIWVSYSAAQYTMAACYELYI